VWVTGLASLAIAGISAYGVRVQYDYNLLHLQASGLESEEVQKRIFDQADNSLLFAVSLADSSQQVLELKKKFEALPTVHHVEELAAILPRYPEEETQLRPGQARAVAPPARTAEPRRVDSLVGQN
jgi:hypothetical protein